MAAYSLTVNGQNKLVTADGDTPLLWVLRDHLGLTGTKFGCGADCAAHARCIRFKHPLSMAPAAAFAAYFSTHDEQGGPIHGQA